MTELSDIEALKAIDEALSSLDDEAKIRVLNWINSKHLGESPAKVAPPAPDVTSKAPTKNKASHKKATKKPKSSLKQIKDLNLFPSGKESAMDFATDKSPPNVKQKCVVALYYLINITEVENVSSNHIYTFFKGVSWKLPTDFSNTLHQAGSEGWLDTADSKNLKLTPLGENVVEHSLAKTKKA